LFGLSVSTNEDGSIIFVGSPANESYSCEWISQADMFQFKDGESVNCREDVKVLKDFYESGGMKNNESAKMSSSHKSGELDVIIIGAGWAGLSAAMTLKAKGITNYKILEARDYLGGRSHTVQETFDGKEIPIDIGSMWLHGGFKNPLYKVIETVGGIPFFKFKFNHKFYQENNGGPLPHKQFLDYHDQFLEDGFMDYQASRQESKSMDQPLKVSADKYINTLSVDLEKQAATKFIKDSIEFEYSAHMNELSLFWWDADHSLDGDLFLPEGYSSLVEAYAAPIMDKIEMETEVTEISYTTKNMEVTCIKNGSKHRLTTKKVIITVPLGVLKADSIKFWPILPNRARKCINEIGMGHMNDKIFMFWNPSDVFWPHGVEELTDMVDRQTNFQFFNLNAYNGNKPMLFAFYSGNDICLFLSLFFN
jgi:polyamine oxidase